MTRIMDESLLAVSSDGFLCALKSMQICLANSQCESVRSHVMSCSSPAFTHATVIMPSLAAISISSVMMPSAVEFAQQLQATSCPMSSSCWPLRQALCIRHKAWGVILPTFIQTISWLVRCLTQMFVTSACMTWCMLVSLATCNTSAGTSQFPILCVLASPPAHQLLQ